MDTDIMLEFTEKMENRLIANQHKIPLPDMELFHNLLQNLMKGDYVDTANYAYLLYERSPRV